jgi:hypothetical protein
LAGVLGGALKEGSLGRRSKLRLYTRRSREDPYLPIGEDAINVEENEFDFLGSRGGRCLGHSRRILAFRGAGHIQARPSQRIGKWRPSFSKSRSEVTRVA